MEAMIKAGKDPYQDWINLVKGDARKVKAQASGDIVQAKLDIEKNEQGQKNGVKWVFGTNVGGVNSNPLRPTSAFNYRF
jgi:hypothetical protein